MKAKALEDLSEADRSALGDRFVEALGSLLFGANGIGDDPEKQGLRMKVAVHALEAIGDEYPHLRFSAPVMALLAALRSTHAHVFDLAQRILKLEAASKQVSMDATVRDRLDEMQAQIKSVKGFTYRDVWNQYDEYSRNDFVTKGGHLWACLMNGCKGVEPGTDGTAWRLAVQRGKEGKPGVVAKDRP